MSALLNVTLLRKRKLPAIRAEILLHLAQKPMRNCDIARALGDKSRQTTFMNMKELVKAGLVKRIGDSEYSITPKGSKLLAELTAA